ncbi:MAG: hypothetical protein FE048_04655 [Thermoplasmata archaeon]|nr:MAG: hypothetical protein FE048_04655 [Thermoplasmata archaeon]
MSNGFDMFDVGTTEQPIVKKEKREFLLAKIAMKIAISIWLAFLVTYVILSFVINESRFALYFAGAITGAFWGSIWNMLLFYRPSSLKTSSLKMRYYGVAFLILVISTAIIFALFPIKEL